MVETPAAALTAAAFDAAFYSIGSNDLVQYTMAAARDNPAVAPLARADSPAVLELIGRTVAAGASRGAEVSVCGDMASQPGFVQTLIGLGLRSFSVAPAQVGRIKRAIGEAVTA
jgi:phosphotransferase system enzyme I (PtsI)